MRVVAQLLDYSKKPSNCTFSVGELYVMWIIYFKINLFIYFWLCWVFVAAHGLSLLAESGGYSLVLRGLLIAVASLVAEHRL